MVWELGIVIAALSTRLTVETGGVDEICPSLSATRQAVHEALSDVAVDTSGWRLWYTVASASDNGKNRLLLELRDAEDQVRLERTLEYVPDECTAMSQAVALVVEGFFHELGQTDDVRAPAVDPRAPAFEPTAPAVRPRAPAVEPSADARVPREPGDLPSQAPEAHRSSDSPALVESKATVSASAPKATTSVGVIAGVSGGHTVDSLLPELGLVAAHHLPALGLLFGGTLTTSWWPREETLKLGDARYQATAQTVWLSLRAALLWERDRWAVSLGPELAMGLDVVKVTPVSLSGKHLRVLPGTGLAWSMTYDLVEGIALGVDANVNAIATPLTYRYYVGPSDELEVLAPSWLRYSGGLSLTSDIF